MMSKLSPRDAVKYYKVSRATLMRALSEGKISASKNEDGHWQIDPSELSRLYQPRSQEKPLDQPETGPVNRSETQQKTDLDHDTQIKLARLEAELDAERQKNALLQQNLEDLRRMLPPPDTKKRWWPWRK